LIFVTEQSLQKHEYSYESGNVFSAINSIEYSSNAVVSKTILKKPAGNISLFSFDAGEGLSEHSSPHEAFVFILDGSAEISVGGKIQNVGKHECIILPANIPHALKATNAFKMLLVMIKS
jgi:quercetin dioxygenase-like cupin family protein